MIKSVVILCSILNNTCITFLDTLGPYESFEECEVRAQEMIIEIENSMPYHKDSQIRCLKMANE